CGEVLIASSAPALGTLRDAAGAFHLDPMPPVLRTGDAGFWTDDGELMIAGRLGNLLKVAGTRVSFDRFVAAVEELAGVDQCVVVDRHGPHAFVAAARLAPGGPEPLRARVRDVARRLGLPRLG